MNFEGMQKEEKAEITDAKTTVDSARPRLEEELAEDSIVLHSIVPIVPESTPNDGTGSRHSDSHNDGADTAEEDEDLMREIEMLEKLVQSAEAAANEKGKLLDYSKTLEEHINKLENLATL